MAKYIKLTAQQKDEIRRLTQLANRRIRNAFKAYEKEGKRVVPLEIVGKPELQTREGWHTEKRRFPGRSSLLATRNIGVISTGSGS